MTREEKLIYARDVLKWTCDEDGNVYNKKGRKIGSLTHRNYLRTAILVNGKRYMISLHQYVYFYFKNKIPILIDHINHITSDNSIENLRDVDNQKNQWNQNLKKIKGYSFHKREKKWQSRIVINNKNIHLGMFDTEEEARRAYLEAKKIHHKI